MKPVQLKIEVLGSMNSQSLETNFVHLMNYGYAAKPQLCFKTWKVKWPTYIDIPSCFSQMNKKSRERQKKWYYSFPNTGHQRSFSFPFYSSPATKSAFIRLL